MSNREIVAFLYHGPLNHKRVTNNVAPPNLINLYKLYTHTLTHSHTNSPQTRSPFVESLAVLQSAKLKALIQYIQIKTYLTTLTNLMNISIPSLLGDLSSGSGSGSTTPHSDEEVILASTRPKKRAGRRIFQETRHLVYRGVRRRNKDKWVCEMRVPNNNKSRIWLGTNYPTPEMAARAHDVAALTLRGKSACLNFADSAWRVRLPESTDAVEIRRAAIEAAEKLSGEPQKQSHYQYHHISSAGIVMDDTNEIMQQQCMYHEQVVPAVLGFEDMPMCFSDEPIMSPPPSPSTTDFITSHWYDVEIFDIPLSLWNF